MVTVARSGLACSPWRRCRGWLLCGSALDDASGFHARALGFDEVDLFVSEDSAATLALAGTAVRAA